MKRRAILVAIALAILGVGSGTAPSARHQDTAASADVVLKPTDHPMVPGDRSQLWLVPQSRGPLSAALAGFVEAVTLQFNADFSRALPILSRPGVRQGVLGHYAEYYRALAELRLGRPAEALTAFRALAERAPAGYLTEAAALREAECHEALGDQAGAAAIYERLSKTKTTAPDDVLMRLGRAAKASGDYEKAAAAFSRIYFELPLSELSVPAKEELDLLPNDPPTAAGTDRYRLELGRAERLFGARRYSQAHEAFESVRSRAQGDDRELVNLRLAECDYYLKRPRKARAGVRPYLDNGSRRGEALFFYALALRDLRQDAEYLSAARRVATEFPDQSWSEEALNNLASYYIVNDEDDTADQIFREMYEEFPSGRYAARAAWKIGWNAYRARRYADTIRVFERAAIDFPRSDYRPAWLYWSGRAHEALNERALAAARYTLAVTDYLNSYYGRLAKRRLDEDVPVRRIVVNAPPPPVSLPPNQDVVRALLEVDLYDQAIDELRFAQKAWGTSAAIEATIAWVYRRQGVPESGRQQFTLYRDAINGMKRAYPQYMASGGEELPRDVLAVIFPLSYWELIRTHSAERGLDPYLVAALVAQESTFVADIRSAANAYGLMQLLPSTARQYARRLKLRYTSRLLTDPEANIRLGTAYLADKIREFGGLHLALASYNAGERRVRRWVAERPGVDPDEFIDDIPFPETQDYVKKILGTAEDYRRLYGSEWTTSHVAEPPTGARATEPAPKAKASTARKKSAAPGTKKRSARPSRPARAAS